jgi:hypothetical protein
MGKVRFFCECGKEIWQDISVERKHYLTIKLAEDFAVCSDCVEERIKARSSKVRHDV